MPPTRRWGKDHSEEVTAMSVPMDLTNELQRSRLPYELVEHRRTESASAEARAVGVPPEQVAKVVVLVAGDGFVRAIVPASRHVDLRKVRRLLETPVRLATEAELAVTYPMYELGAVPPFGVPTGDRVLVEEVLARRDSVVFDAGTHSESLWLKTADLLTLSGGEVVDIAAGA
jgi:Ala-tRNA(Pro) deacylase